MLAPAERGAGVPAGAALSALPRALALACGSYPAALALEPVPLAALALAIAASPLVLAPGIQRLAGAAGLACVMAWLTLAIGHARCFERCRAAARAAGLDVVVVVPESPRLAAWLLRRRGFAVPSRRRVCSVHVDPGWRPPAGLGPAAAAARFGMLYRQDYDRLLAALAGQDVLVASSTFNRHASAWTRRAAMEGWGQSRAGPLFPAAPGRQRPGRRRRDQIAMFGAPLSARRVDRPAAWRCRLFDCAGIVEGGERR